MPFGTTSDHNYVTNSMDFEFQIYKYKTTLGQHNSLQKCSGLGLCEMVTLNNTLNLITGEWSREMEKNAKCSYWNGDTLLLVLPASSLP